MIYGEIKNAECYLGINKNLDVALQYMMHTDMAALGDGKHVIDGENVFVNVMQAVTQPDRYEYEFHQEYYDIQIDLAGAEDILFSGQYQEITRPYQKDGDIGMGRCICEAVCHLKPGKFVICEPGEPHLPVVATDNNEETIRKAVIKVHR